jgi:lysophospholipase L1-like esterase
MSTNWIDALNQNKNLYNLYYEFNNLILDENCFKFLNSNKYLNKQCKKNVEIFQKDLAINKYDKIFILLRWGEKSTQHLNSLINYLNHFNSQIYFVGNAKFKNVAKISYNIAININVNEKNLAEEFFRNVDKKSIFYNNEIKKISSNKKLNYINGYDLYCTSNMCKLFDDDLNLFMWDEDHLTEYGSRFLGKKIIKFFLD